MTLTAEERKAFEQRYHDLPWYAEHAPLNVLDKRTTTMGPLRLNVAQKYVMARQWQQARSGRPVRSLIPKFRQGGITTLGLAHLMHVSQTRTDRMLMLMLHDLELAEPMYDRLEKMHEGIGKVDEGALVLPKAKATTKKTGRELGFDTGSLIQITTAGKQKGIGRGNTIHHIKATELPSWPNPTMTMKGIMESVPELGMFESSITLESTSEGVGDWWYWACMNASEGKGEFDLIFLPWWIELAYGIEDPKPWDLRRAWDPNGSERLADCLVVPLNADEEQLGKRILREAPSFGIGYLTPDMVVQKLLWRRRKIESIRSSSPHNAEQTFMQEYPSTLAESFQGTGRPVFKAPSIAFHRARLATDDQLPLIRPALQRVDVFHANTIIDGLREKQVWEGRLDREGALHVWKGFEDGERYMIGGDPASGEGDDPSAIQVCKVGISSVEQVAVWHGWTGMIDLAHITAWLAQKYGNAMMIPEVTGLGAEYVNALMRIRWPGRRVYHRRVLSRTGEKMMDRPGFDMGVTTRPAVIENLYAILQTEDIVIRHEQTMIELEQFRLDNGKPDHPAGGHSDLMMALGLVVFARHQHGTPVSRPKVAQGVRYEASKQSSVRMRVHAGK